MPWYDIVWNFEPGRNVEHIAEHGLTPEDVEAVFCDPIDTTTSRRTGRPVATGYTENGRLIVVIYEILDDLTVYPVTAYEIDPSREAMPHEIRNRITRPATPEEAARHKQLREEIAQELPELSAWARQAAASHQERISVGTVFGADESPILTAIDDYATKHALPGRSAVVREALAQLLGIPVRQQ